MFPIVWLLSWNHPWVGSRGVVIHTSTWFSDLQTSAVNHDQAYIKKNEQLNYISAIKISAVTGVIGVEAELLCCPSSQLTDKPTDHGNIHHCLWGNPPWVVLWCQSSHESPQPCKWNHRWCQSRLPLDNFSHSRIVTDCMIHFDQWPCHQ